MERAAQVVACHAHMHTAPLCVCVCVCVCVYKPLPPPSLGHLMWCDVRYGTTRHATQFCPPDE